MVSVILKVVVVLITEEPVEVVSDVSVLVNVDDVLLLDDRVVDVVVVVRGDVSVEAELVVLDVSSGRVVVVVTEVLEVLVMVLVVEDDSSDDTEVVDVVDFVEVVEEELSPLVVVAEGVLDVSFSELELVEAVEL